METLVKFQTESGSIIELSSTTTDLNLVRETAKEFAIEKQWKLISITLKFL